jgi:hypothetical protein
MAKKSERLLEKHGALINEPIHTNAVYTYGDAVVLTKSSYDTICRAVLGGHLKASGNGTYRIILGEWLLDWVKAGCPTGRKKSDS